MHIKWKRLDRATAQITAYAGAILALGLGSGILIGAELEPPEVVEIRTTVTLAKPPVCEYAIEAGRAEMSFAKDRDRASNDATVHGDLAAAAANLGHVNERLTEQDLANQFELDRDTAEFARIGAEQSFMTHAAACDTWEVAQRFTERILQ